MELKCQDDAGINLRLHCSNRIFMELKFLVRIALFGIRRSNRTFMELKSLLRRLISGR